MDYSPNDGDNSLSKVNETTNLKEIKQSDSNNNKSSDKKRKPKNKFTTIIVICVVISFLAIITILGIVRNPKIINSKNKQNLRNNIIDKKNNNNFTLSGQTKLNTGNDIDM